MEEAERTYPWIAKDLQYGSQHKLQNYDICFPRPLKESPVDKTLWVLYVPPISPILCRTHLESSRLKPLHHSLCRSQPIYCKTKPLNGYATASSTAAPGATQHKTKPRSTPPSPNYSRRTPLHHPLTLSNISPPSSPSTTGSPPTHPPMTPEIPRYGSSTQRTFAISNSR